MKVHPANIALGLFLTLFSGLFVPSAFAVPVEVSFDLNNEISHTGNTRTYNAGGLDLLVTSFSNEDLLSGLVFVDAQLREYGGGLGIFSPEGGDNHTVDNNSRGSAKWDDFLLFELSDDVHVGSFRLSAFGDTDIQAWVGTSAPNLSIAGQSISDLGFTDLGANLGENQTRTAVYDNFGVTGNYILLGALPGEKGDSFKVKNLTVYTPEDTEVPEPASLLLLGAGLLGFRVKNRLT